MKNRVSRSSSHRVNREASKELEKLVMEGVTSGEPKEAGPGYWEEKHKQLDERLALSDKRD